MDDRKKTVEEIKELLSKWVEEKRSPLDCMAALSSCLRAIIVSTYDDEKEQKRIWKSVYDWGKDKRLKD